MLFVIQIRIRFILLLDLIFRIDVVVLDPIGFMKLISSHITSLTCPLNEDNHHKRSKGFKVIDRGILRSQQCNILKTVLYLITNPQNLTCGDLLIACNMLRQKGQYKQRNKIKNILQLLVFNSGKRLGVKSLPLSWNPQKGTKKNPSAQNVAMVWE